MAGLIFLPPAARYLKKLKDKNLKKLYEDAVRAICNDPTIGESKHGDLKGVFGYDIYYNKINYELAYTVEERVNEESGETETVVVIMAGTREKFYDELKRYWL
ncbi:MAG: type II toxin-antitoxin system RelE/ParE family toxin [Lachnospiraceae bacterium]|nr:type II toxin-antitoxin system RelE/ParE family toxin [Lachnospiraceae bacterium]